MYFSINTFAIAGLVLLTGVHHVAAETDIGSSDIAYEKCNIGSSGRQMQAQCTSINVPLDPSDHSKGNLALSLARIQSQRQSGNTDALTLIAGGPGQSALDTFPAVAFAFRHIMRDRDVILIDQRGTGESTLLDCPESEQMAQSDSAVNLQTDPQILANQAKECLDSLPADPTLFTTSIAIQDLEAVRQHLGISQWNLYGISYGSRVATHYLRRFPEAVRSLILDAVVPPQITLGPDIGTFAQASLEHIFKRCQRVAACYEAFGDLMDPTFDLLDELADKPRTLSYEDIATGRLTTREFTREQLASILRLMSYSSQSAAILPSMLHEAISNNNLAPLARQADIQSASLGNSLATGMHHAVVCTEDVPFFDPETNVEAGAASIADRSYLGEKMISSISASCRHWPAGRIDHDFKFPLISDKPTLILSGAADPITPPSYGDLLAEGFENVLHIVNEAQGHMQAPLGCMPVLMAKFIEQANVQSLDTSCLERLRPTPFFVDANGPLP